MATEISTATDFRGFEKLNHGNYHNWEPRAKAELMKLSVWRLCTGEEINHSCWIHRHMLSEIQEGAVHADDEHRDEEPPVDVPMDDGSTEWTDIGPFEETSNDAALLDAIKEAVHVNSWNYRAGRDQRTWKDRLRNRNANWAPLMDSMAISYLQWKYPSPSTSTLSDAASHSMTTPDSDTPMASPAPTTGVSPSASPENVASAENVDPSISENGASTSSPASDRPEDLSITVSLLDIFTLSRTATIVRSPSSTTATAMVESGYLAHVPFHPSVVISLRTLELYRRLRLRKPSFSVEAFAKVICDFYMMPYRPKYRAFIGDAFEIYILILRKVDGMVQNALGRDTPNWRVLNSCPPCTYVLEGEPELVYARLIAMDGNDSLKRVDAVGNRGAVSDLRKFDSDYFIPPEEVNPWADQVPSRRPANVPSLPSAPNLPSDPVVDPETNDIITEEDVHDHDDPTAGCDVTTCVKNWKAAQLDALKKAWAIFLENGLFASACRHGFILWLADLIRSGEQAKYPLAIISRLLEILGPRILVGYDIGCAFQSTVNATSLGPKFKELGCRLCVNAYHGYAHNFACQTKNHPNIIEGVGLEDLEILERVFSASNEVAGVTRFATSFRRRMFLHIYYQQWDDDKYNNLATMLLNNYKQALKIIEEEGRAVDEVLKQIPNATYATLDEWQLEQAQYFGTLGKEPEWDVHAVAYVELLRELGTVTVQCQSAFDRFVTATPTDYQYNAPVGGPMTYDSELSKTRRLESLRRFTDNKQMQLELKVLAMEVKMGITERWTAESSEYRETLKYISQRKYNRALDKLQQLVIQRLFELHRLNLNGIAYRARTHLSKSLQVRSKAIKHATEAYNKAAKELNPPKPSLDWTQISRFNFIEEFDLLHNTRNDLVGKEWANSVNRVTMKQYQRVKRAHEEILRCNVEVRRLYTHINDEHRHFSATLANLKASSSPVYGALKEHCIRRLAVNQMLLKTIQQIHNLHGFTGDPTLGHRVGVASSPSTESEVGNKLDDVMQSLSTFRDGTNFSMVTDGDDEDSTSDADIEEVQTGGLIDFVAGLSIS